MGPMTELDLKLHLREIDRQMLQIHAAAATPSKTTSRGLLAALRRLLPRLLTRLLARTGSPARGAAEHAGRRP